MAGTTSTTKAAKSATFDDSAIGTNRKCYSNTNEDSYERVVLFARKGDGTYGSMYGPNGLAEHLHDMLGDYEYEYGLREWLMQSEEIDNATFEAAKKAVK